MTDLALTQRLERAEGATNAAFVEAHARLDPAAGATWHDFDGTYAMFDGADSPITQTFGLGLFTPPTHESLAPIEEFFVGRGAPVFHETSPLADPTLLSLLAARLEYAGRMGCDVAVMGAQPGSGSQRNAERRGFRVGYTRTKWQLSPR